MQKKWYRTHSEAFDVARKSGMYLWKVYRKKHIIGEPMWYVAMDVPSGLRKRFEFIEESKDGWYE